MIIKIKMMYTIIAFETSEKILVFYGVSFIFVCLYA